MQIIRHFDEDASAASARSVLAIGNFDGVHRGHQHVLGLGRRLAREQDVPFGAMSFEPHPRAFFAKDKPFFRLTPEEDKLRLLAAAGADFAAIVPFDEALASTEPEVFLSQLVVRALGAAHVVVGFDFHFGAKRRGTPDFLKEWGAAHGLGVTLAEAHTDGEEPISSSRIRAALEAGDVDLANQLLGYRWFVSSKVIHGEKRGRTLGYPTANMALPPQTGLAHGIYAVRAEVGGRLYGGAASFGRRPQFDNGNALLEPYLFDFEGNLYGREISVEFIARLRGEERFDTVAALVAQMDRDCERARTAIASAAGVSIIAGEALSLA